MRPSNLSSISIRVALVALLLSPSIAPAAEAVGVIINGVYLTPGMKKDDVLLKLGETGQIKRFDFDSQDLWCVQTKNFSGAPWDCSIVDFRNGRLFRATQRIQQVTTGAAALLFIHAAVKAANDRGETAEIKIGTEMNGPDPEFRSLDVSVGGLVYEIEINKEVGAGPNSSRFALTKSVTAQQ